MSAEEEHQEQQGQEQEEDEEEPVGMVQGLRALFEGMQARAAELRAQQHQAQPQQNQNENQNDDDDDDDDSDDDDISEAEAEANNGQIIVTAMLEAYPAEKANSNKIILPHELLTELSDKRVWDNRPAGKPILFQLEVADPETQDVIETTYAGVEEFTAAAGKVGLPHKTALSLTKKRGVGWLKQNPMVCVSYVNLPTHAQSFMQIQPRGQGFHLDAETVVNLDIKAILEKTLRDHIVLTRGDWIPIYHEGRWFELVVKDTRPDETLEVLNTDLEVDILPSENVELEQTALQEAKDKLKQFMDSRNKRAKEKAEKLNAVKEPAKSDKSSVLVRVRLPNGKAKTRRFEIGALFGLIMDWTEHEMFKAEFIPAELPEAAPEDYWFKIVEKIPGKSARSLTGEDAWKPLKQVMAEGEGVRSGISLIVEVLKNKDGPGSEESQGKEGSKDGEATEDTNEWLKAFENLHRRMEAGAFEPVPEPEIEQNEIDALAERLVEYGVEEELAKDSAAKYPKQLLQLESMGYADRMNEVIESLERTRGGINQTIDSLLQSSLNETGTDNAVVSVGSNDQEEDEEEGVPEVSQEEIEALAQRLVSYGVAEDVANTNAAKYPKQLAQIESMGYLDKMNEAIALLETKNGNLNRTMDAILHGALNETLTDYDTDEDLEILEEDLEGEDVEVEVEVETEEETEEEEESQDKLDGEAGEKE